MESDTDVGADTDMDSDTDAGADTDMDSDTDDVVQFDPPGDGWRSMCIWSTASAPPVDLVIPGDPQWFSFSLNLSGTTIDLLTPEERDMDVYSRTCSANRPSGPIALSWEDANGDRFDLYTIGPEGSPAQLYELIELNTAIQVGMWYRNDAGGSAGLVVDEDGPVMAYAESVWRFGWWGWEEPFDELPLRFVAGEVQCLPYFPYSDCYRQYSIQVGETLVPPGRSVVHRPMHERLRITNDWLYTGEDWGHHRQHYNWWALRERD